MFWSNSKTKIQMLRNKFLRAGLAFSFLAILGLGTIHFLKVAPSVRNGIISGLILALFNGILSFISLRWSFRRSNKIFFGTFFSSMLWKLLVLGGLFFYLLGQTYIDPATALVTLAMMTFLLNIFGLGFLPLL